MPQICIENTHDFLHHSLYHVFYAYIACNSFIVCTETILFEGSHQNMELNEFFLPSITYKTRRSVEHCTPHADGAWLNELGWSQ